MKNSNIYKGMRIFEEADGFHFCESSLDYMDARGRGFPSRAAAKRAINESLRQIGTDTFTKNDQ